MKLLPLRDAHIILLSTAASLLAGVVATPLPLALRTDTAAVSRALGPHQVHATARREPINFNYVRDTHAADPLHLVVASGRGLPENTSPGLTSVSSGSDPHMSRDLSILLTRRNIYDEVPILTVSEKKFHRPSLKAVDNPIQHLLETELAKEKFQDPNMSLGNRMLHLDFLFALTEESGFEVSLVTKLTEQMDKDHQAFMKSVQESALAQRCLRRLQYFRAVLGHRDTVAKAPTSRPPQIWDRDLSDDETYTTFLRKELTTLTVGGEGGTPQEKKKLTLAEHITEMGLRYNLIREMSRYDWRVRNPEMNQIRANLRYFEALKGDEGSEAEIRECKARAEYYRDLLIEAQGFLPYLNLNDH